MKGFLCEPTLDGVFTGIYDIWADREKEDHKKLFLEGEYEPELFFDYLKVEPDSKKAEKVARSGNPSGPLRKRAVLYEAERERGRMGILQGGSERGKRESAGRGIL